MRPLYLLAVFVVKRTDFIVTVFRFLQLKNALLLIFIIFVPIVTFMSFLLLLKAFDPMDVTL